MTNWVIISNMTWAWVVLPASHITKTQLVILPCILTNCNACNLRVNHVIKNHVIKYNSEYLHFYILSEIRKDFGVR
jgi:tetrahydromethanopterin S-methyltransferase subunit A